MSLFLRIAIWISFLYMASELTLTIVKRSSGKTAVKRKDRGSMIIIWVIISLGIYFGFRYAHYRDWNSLNYLVGIAGYLFIISGLVIRWTSIFQLNKGFTVDVSIGKDHKLKTDGIYGVVRHPSYLGILLFITGLSLVMNSLLSIAIIVLPVTAALLYRIHVEEDLLLEGFGEEYRKYQQKTRRLLPFIY
jgi:protein-S-isoprenylcysteine O-methyltransferase Ste14